MSAPNLILTSCAGYDWSQIEMFFVSLKRFVKTARCICFTFNVSTETLQKMQSYGVEIIPMELATPVRKIFNILKKVSNRNFFSKAPLPIAEFVCLHSSHIVTFRNFYYYELLKTQNNVHSVLFTDIQDVVFQADPFESLPNKRGVYFYLEDEVNNRIRTIVSPNDEWYRKYLGPEKTLFLDEKISSCAGTTIGSFQPMLMYLKTFKSLAAKSLVYADYGSDQAIHNFMLYMNEAPFQRIVVPNANGEVLTVLNSRSSTYSLREDGCIVDVSTRPIPIVHTYDRFPELVSAQRKRLGL